MKGNFIAKLSQFRLGVGLFVIAFLWLFIGSWLRIAIGSYLIWDNATDFFHSILLMALHAVLAIPISMGIAAVAYSGRRRPTRWLSLFLGVIVILGLLVRSLQNETVTYFVVVFGLLGLWLGQSKLITVETKRHFASIGMVGAASAAFLWICDYFISFHISQKFVVILLYAFLLGAIATLVSRIHDYRKWQITSGIAVTVVAFILLREPYLPLYYLGMSPSYKIPYIESTHPVQHVLLIIGIIAGVANGRQGNFNRMTEQTIRKWSVIGWFTFTLLMLLGWEYPDGTGAQEITILVATLWIYSLLSVEPDVELHQ